MPRPIPFLLALLGVCLNAAPTLAGTLCGTVRDAQTNAPLPGAVVLVFATNGEYSGFSAMTDGAGEFCVEDIAAGTYDLQVRVRNHVAGTVKNVVVTDDVTGIIVDARPAALFLRVAPNPMRGSTTIRFGSEDAARSSITVHDIRGRLLRAWRDETPPGAERSFTWDGRDAEGRAAPPGIYFVRFATDAGAVSRSLVLLP